MITKILSAAQSASVSIDYNENKREDTNEVKLAFTHLINGFCREDIVEALLDLEENPKVDIQMKNFGFHAVFSPSKTEATTEDEMKTFIGEWMEKMGYGDQPYAVYKHQDTDNVHFHVVSTRVNAEGKKIDDSFEKARSLQLLKDLAEKYHYTPGDGTALLKKEERRKAREERKAQRQEAMRNNRREYDRRMSMPERFSIKKGEVMEQFRTAFEESMTYNFTSFHQFEAIMAARGIIVKQAKWEGEDKDSLVFQGLSKRGHEATRLYGEDEVGIDAMKLLQEKMAANKQEHPLLRREKIRVENISKRLFEWSTSRRHYERMLQQKGIDVVFSREKDNPSNIIGATFVDHSTKTAFKASELDKAVAAAEFNKAFETGHWKYHDTSRDIDDKELISEKYNDELLSDIKAALAELGKPGPSPFKNTHGNPVGRNKNNELYEQELAEGEQRRLEADAKGLGLRR